MLHKSENLNTMLGDHETVKVPQLERIFSAVTEAVVALPMTDNRSRLLVSKLRLISQAVQETWCLQEQLKSHFFSSTVTFALGVNLIYDAFRNPTYQHETDLLKVLIELPPGLILLAWGTFDRGTFGSLREENKNQLKKNSALMLTDLEILLENHPDKAALIEFLKQPSPSNMYRVAMHLEETISTFS